MNTSSSHSRALDNILVNKRSLVISRSTFPGTGAHSGHWLGDNNAAWDNTYWSIPGTHTFFTVKSDLKVFPATF